MASNRNPDQEQHVEDDYSVVLDEEVLNGSNSGVVYDYEYDFVSGPSHVQPKTQTAAMTKLSTLRDEGSLRTRRMIAGFNTWMVATQVTSRAKAAWNSFQNYLHRNQKQTVWQRWQDLVCSWRQLKQLMLMVQAFTDLQRQSNALQSIMLQSKQEKERRKDRAICELKDKGTESFGKKKYRQAAELFSKALKIDSSNPALLTNRAAAYLEMCKFEMALDDCDMSLCLDPSWLRGYQRKCDVLMRQNDFTQCIAVADKGLQMEPNADLMNIKDRALDMLSAASEQPSKNSSAREGITDDPPATFYEAPVLASETNDGPATAEFSSLSLGSRSNTSSSSETSFREGKLVGKIHKVKEQKPEPGKGEKSTIKPGTRVRITHLKQQPELNQKVGVVKAWDSDAQRYSVKIKGIKRIKLMKAGNLMLQPKQMPVEEELERDQQRDWWKTTYTGEVVVKSDMQLRQFLATHGQAMPNDRSELECAATLLLESLSAEVKFRTTVPLEGLNPDICPDLDPSEDLGHPQQAATVKKLEEQGLDLSLHEGKCWMGVLESHFRRRHYTKDQVSRIGQMAMAGQQMETGLDPELDIRKNISLLLRAVDNGTFTGIFQRMEDGVQVEGVMLHVDRIIDVHSTPLLVIRYVCSQAYQEKPDNLQEVASARGTNGVANNKVSKSELRCLQRLLKENRSKLGSKFVKATEDRWKQNGGPLGK